jgi:acyl-coenzyme A thioesterase 13
MELEDEVESRVQAVTINFLDVHHRQTIFTIGQDINKNLSAQFLAQDLAFQTIPFTMTSPNPQSDPQTLTHITSLWSTLLPASPIYSFLLSDLAITHASKGLILARLTLSPTHLNSKSGLHGSVSATIIDAFGGLAIASTDLREKTGASVDLNVSYLGSAGLGDVIEIEGRAEKVGGSLAFTSVTIYKVKEGVRGDAIVMGRHTKFVRQPAARKE